MANVVIIGHIPPNSAERMKAVFPPDWTVNIAAPEDASPFLAEADAVIPEHVRIDREFLDKAPKLKLVQTGAGYDNVDIPACTERGIPVCNAAGINATAVAEHVMAMILGWYKNIPYLDRFMKERRDKAEPDYAGGEIYGKTVGIIGFGAVGKKVAGYCIAFGMNVLACHTHRVELTGVEQVDLDALLRRSDIVSVHVPLTAETRGMIGREALAKMKSSALLVNTARGAIVDEAALTEALQKRTIAGACLDVYEKEPLSPESPLRALPNVILTPHTAGLPDGRYFHLPRYVFFCQNIERVMHGQPPENALNHPA